MICTVHVYFYVGLRMYLYMCLAIYAAPFEYFIKRQELHQGAIRPTVLLQDTVAKLSRSKLPASAMGERFLLYPMQLRLYCGIPLPVR